jgi:hypothetical protein
MTVLKKAGGQSPAKEQGKSATASAPIIYSWNKYSFSIYQNIGTTMYIFFARSERVNEITRFCACCISKIIKHF